MIIRSLFLLVCRPQFVTRRTAMGCGFNNKREGPRWGGYCRSPDVTCQLTFEPRASAANRLPARKVAPPNDYAAWRLRETDRPGTRAVHALQARLARRNPPAGACLRSRSKTPATRPPRR